MDPEKFKYWRDQDFPPGSRTRASFDHLCDLGCDPRLLLNFLTLAIFNANSPRTIYDIYGLSRSALLKLPESLEKISHELQSVSPLLEHYIQANFVNNPNYPNQVRNRCLRQLVVYRKTPQLLQLLAGHLRMSEEWVQNNFGPKRFDTFRKSVLELLEYVDICTKTPQYERVSELLEHLFSLKEKTFRRIASKLPQAKRIGTREKMDTPPKLLYSSDALKVLYKRSTKYGFRKTRPGASRRRSS